MKLLLMTAAVLLVIGSGSAVFAGNNNESSFDEYGFEETCDEEGLSQETILDSTKKQDSAVKSRGTSAYGKPSAFSGSEKFYQKGTASWYGREFQGKITASGERFDMNGFSAAHRELPFGTVIEIKNLKNGCSVRAKVNDRGPYKGNRIVDLSYAAANELGYIRDGEASVGITVIKWGDGKRQSSSAGRKKIKAESAVPVVNYTETKPVKAKAEYVPAGGNLCLQAGAFYSRDNAEGLKIRIEDLTFRSVVIVQDNDMFKVRIQGIPDRNEMAQLKSAMEEEGIHSFSVKAE